MRHDMSHMSVIDTAPIVREDHTGHGLHLNARGKRKLVRLITDSVRCEHGSVASNIPVVVHARATPFLG